MTTLAEKETDEKLAIALEFAEVKLSVSEMIATVDQEAHRLEGSERARLLAGLVEEPDAGQVLRIAHLLAVMRTLQSFYDRPATAANFFSKMARKRAGNE